MFWKRKKKKKAETTNSSSPKLEDSFKAAFGLVISEIEGAGSIPLANLYNAINDHRGDTRNQKKAISECLAGTDWIWPIYKSYTQGQQSVIYEVQVSEIENSKPKELLSRFTVPQLKDIHLQCYGKKPKSSLRKMDIVKQIMEGKNETLFSKLKQEQIESLKNPFTIDKKQMAEALVRKIESLAYSLHRKEQMINVATVRPYWEFKVILDPSTPDECKLLHGTIKHYSDPFWQENYPPCWRPDCRCYVQSHSKRSFENTDSKSY